MIQGILQEPTSLSLTTTNVTDVLAFSAGDSGAYTVESIRIVNEDTTDRIVTVWWTKNTTDYAIYEATVGANSSVDVIDVPIKLIPKGTARKIRAQAAAANVVTVTVVYSLGGPQVAN